MAQLGMREKLAILADAAKYDASCASSGTAKRSSIGGKGIGSTEGMGICHAYAPDGRCISLLKILLTNSCIFDCHYCINRKSSNVRRARFTTQEVVQLTLSFYKRNYIEGLFLSSGIIRSSNYTMEQIVEVARSLREDHDFRGYIHLKTIPDADPALVHQAGLHADRVSINVELPTASGLTKFAPEKNAARIEGAMAEMNSAIVDTRDAARRFKSAPTFAPAGQSTQMIVGADGADDRAIIGRVQPDPRRQRGAAVEAPAADARAPALPVGLADALLRLRASRGRRGRRRRRHAAARHRSQARLGAEVP
jgi:putative DNA modification/repair radical SAM protein